MVDLKQKGLKIGTSPKNGHLSQRYVFLHLLFLHVTLLFLHATFLSNIFFSMHSFFQFDMTIFLRNTLYWQSRVFLEEILTISWSVTMKVSPNKMPLKVQFFETYFLHIQLQMFFKELNQFYVHD